MKTLLLTLSLLCTTLAGFAQQGTLAGKVKDKKTGEPIIGAVVFITGSGTAASTDMDGGYDLKIQPGIYKITVSYVSYKPAVYDNIKVEAGKTTTMDFLIEETASTALNAVTIVGTRQTNTDISLIKELKQSEVVVSGVSGEQITKSLDRDAAETVKRIPGVTIMNDKYIVIRGMNERYNSVMLNDALTPSTEPDSRAFSFDILPTSVIDRILIYKNGSPELPGDFAGGVIKVFTKNFADENTTTLGASVSYRGNTTFGNFLTPPTTKTDFLGFDNGKRSLPSSFPSDIRQIGSGSELTSLGRQLPNTWTGSRGNALPDMRFSLGMTRLLDVKDVQMSNVTAISYSNTRLFTRGSRIKYQDFDASTGKSPQDFNYQDENSTQSSRLGVLHNWTARFNNRNKIEFSNLFNQMGSNSILFRKGTENFNGLEQQNYALRYESRTIYTGQLQGTHDFNDLHTTATWTGGYSYTNRNEPDYRRVRTQRAIGTTDPFEVAYKFTPSLNDAGRFYSDLNEHLYTAAGQVEHRFNIADSLSENSPKIRAGFYVERKNRDFNARFLSYRPADPGSFDARLPFLPLDQVFAEQNINATTGWEIVEGTNPTDSYTAFNTLIAGYVGGAFPFTDKLSISGGARFEYNHQNLESLNALRETYQFDDKVARVLPSANLTYEFSKRSMLRAGASISLNRPQFREVAPFSYYNFMTLFEEKGAPLKTATIYNADLRYEFYPSPTELLSVGVFGKHFKDPIEKYFEITNMGNSLTYTNTPTATTYGVEVEARKSLAELTQSPILQKVSVLLNASLIKSKVDLTGDAAAGLSYTSRPMMGQSPYVVNAGLYFQDDDRQLQVNMLYNVVGSRIWAVGSYANPMVYEMPRHVLDLAFTKGFGRHFEIKGGIQDILNQQVRLIQDSNDDAKITGMDETIQAYQRGSYSTLGLSYKF
ncbi:TonB-dependent receptor domain-containing protein [Rufibacter glacialis]|uniref:TonB-dependent receptor domain-containing protein n=1 Tax=Rufibacter glacialis TaxID=1259555 RepID=A0A5M8QM03_9BACT|nr:TonB-dependent receptor [Rufibacter glacialis]KAA6437175.1 TonB-dependent receptor plug domain-containing protein [Rufibacter glacialis]GGK61446.1 outer membrane protein [Rufibacter glacialis]